LYDPHLFDEMAAILEPWLRLLTEDELIVGPETRVMVFNTLARALVILGRGEWIELFRKSEIILHEYEPTDLPRTWNFLAHGLIRSGQLDKANSVLVQAENWPGISELSRWFCCFLRAEYSRSCGQQSFSDEMEAAPNEKKRAGHPFGFYFRATARQPDRTKLDAVNRFRRARDFFLQDAGSGDPPNILHFLADCMRLGEAGWSADAPLWCQARCALARHLEPRSGCKLAEHYKEVWTVIGDYPDRDAAEALLRRVPFF
jgi:hypothetical protein